jgi:hypothetical protein
MEAMKPHVTEEGKTAQDNFTRAMKTLFRTPKATAADKKTKTTEAKKAKHS